MMCQPRNTTKTKMTSSEKYASLPEPDAVAATKTFHHATNDPICDFLEAARQGEREPLDDFTKQLFRAGQEFEESVLDMVKDKLGEENVHICPARFSGAGVQRVEELIAHRVPVIYSGSIYSRKLKQFGVPDLLVRCDILPQLFDHMPQISLLPEGHYRALDIKGRMLNILKDGRRLAKTDPKVAAFSQQLCIYNGVLGELQGYTPPEAFIVGKGVNENGERFVGPLYKPGLVEMTDRLQEETLQSVEWVRRSKGQGLSAEPPSQYEMYPNMKNEYNRFSTVKRELAISQGEITLLLQCGLRARQKAFDAGVTSFYDKRCTSALMGIPPAHAAAVDAIIRINQPDARALITPRRVRTSVHGWKLESPDIYVDFEKSVVMAGQPDMVFMIGCGSFRRDKWVYRSFVATELTEDDERRIVSEFLEYIGTLRYERAWFWFAEPIFWKQVLRRLDLDEKAHRVHWRDMRDIFTLEPIAIRGCHNYKLKNVVAALNKHGLIQSNYSQVCSDGVGISVKLEKYFNGVRDPAIMKEIEDYNEVDCRVLFEILEYLRKVQ